MKRDDRITSKRKLQILIDAAMTALLPCLMAYQLISGTAHEWLGMSVFLLFILHHALNFRWYRTLNKGHWSCSRILGIAVNVLLFADMVFLIISGILMSRHVFAFLSIDGGTSFVRVLHLLASYWGFVLMSMHIGLHWNMIMAMMRKAMPDVKPSLAQSVALSITTVLICVYGIYAFINHKFAEYMFLKNQFVFFDFNKPIIFFFADYLATMALFAALGYCLSMLSGKVSIHR
jgi:hypothetical protein